ncbi:multicopper oxidase family protein [Terribacillus saccharophilus]|uniref:multicopper oxidase family protein n=1 Tax=Terribacillus saccharophilus TaxID=361277 RepID=UPI00380621B7
MKLKIAGFLLLFLFILGACSSAESTDSEQTESSRKETAKTEVLTGNTFDLVAEEAAHSLNSEVDVEAWTFNNSVPGPELRVKEGEEIKINLKNKLPDPVTIHWHGVPLENNMDGIPGVTQNAVQPGDSYTYNFTASVPGTYMYHTHQDGVNQVDKGLYGSLIVEPDEVSYDQDYVMMLDEWMSNPVTMDMANMDHENMSGMGDSEESAEEKSMADDMSNYDIFTINGKSGDEVETLTVKEGEKVRLRLANIGFMSHQIHLHGHDFKVVAIDGQEIKNPDDIKDQLLSIAPGERYDIEFTADNPGEWYLECHGEMEGTKGMKARIQYENQENESTDKPNDTIDLPKFDFMTYGEDKKAAFTLDQIYDVEYTMNLNTEAKNNATVYTINRKTYPDTDNIQVEKGDLVKVKLVNKSDSEDHPMHLHGHFFQVLSKNGKPAEGAPILKDTINVKPGDEYIVAFKADNPGNWLFHCHDLHHASAGMVSLVSYKDYIVDFSPDPDVNNKPE